MRVLISETCGDANTVIAEQRRTIGQLLARVRYWRGIALGDDFIGAPNDLIDAQPPVGRMAIPMRSHDTSILRGHDSFSVFEAAVRERGASADDDLVERMFNARDAVLDGEPATEPGYAARLDAMLHQFDIMAGGRDGLPSIAAVRADLASMIRSQVSAFSDQGGR